MSEWREFRLGDAITVKHGFAFKSEYFCHAASHIVLTPGNFHDAGGFKPKSGAEKFYDGPLPKGYVLKRGDVVVAMTEQAHGLLGSSATIPTDDTYLHNQRIGLVSIEDSVALDLRFVYHLLNSTGVRTQLRATATGSKVRHTAPERIVSVRVPIPDTHTQRRIAEILDAIDDLIENNRRRIALLEQMAQAIYREWFVHFRYPGHEDDALVDSSLGAIPAGWEVVRLGTIADTQYGFTDSATRSPEGPKFLRVTDINKRSYISWPEVPHCSPGVPGRFRLARGDVVVARMADPGKIGFVEREVDAVFASYLVRLRPIAQWLDPYYFYFVVSADAYQEFVLGASTGTTRKSISAKVMEDGLILQPPPGVVGGFVELVVPVREELTTLAEAAEHLRSLRDLLLPKLVTGAIDVSHLDLDALLDRDAL